MTQSDLSFSCVLVRQEGGYTALCLDLDVASEGPTPGKARSMLREAVELYIDSAIENNQPYLRPVPQKEDPRRIAPDDVIKTFNLRVNLAVRVHA